MNKSKLKWKYAYEPYNLVVLRGGEKTEVRVCAHGYDEQGEIRSTLYCTRDGKFFSRTPDGWRELKPSTNPSCIRKKSGKGSSYPLMQNLGHLMCHKLVCTAFHGECPEGYECDHINGSNLDWSADNVRWVTKMENIRCGRYLRRLRKHGIDPKRLRYSLLLGLYSLSWERFEICLHLFDGFCLADPFPLSEFEIEANLQLAFTRFNQNYIKLCQEKQER